MSSKLSEKLALVATIDPDAYTTGAYTSDWVDMTFFRRVVFYVLAGTLGSSATLDCKLQEATDSSGTGNTDISGKSITQLTQAGSDSDKQAEIEIADHELSAGFTHVAAVMTVGTATSDAGVAAIAGVPRYHPASDHDLSSVDEIVA